MILSSKESLKCFEKENRGKNFLARVNRRIQTVMIDKIVGSVSRCVDFDREFSVQNKKDKQHILSKVGRIKENLQQGKSIPLVDLYKIGDEYYVVDGHHRIAAAKEAGRKFIDAQVVEYLPSGSSQQNLLLRKKIEFEFETGLEGINLSQRDDYDKLLAQIREHREYLKEDSGVKFSLREAARDWFQSVYLPVTEKIKKANLKEYFPEASIADIYMYLCDQVRMRNRRKGKYNVGVEETLEEFGLLTKATKLIFSDEGFKNKLLKLLSPCFYLKKCPFDVQKDKLCRI